MDKNNFSLEILETGIKFNNNTDHTLEVYSKPIPPKRKIRLELVVQPRSFTYFDFGIFELDFTRLYFSLNPNKEYINA